MPRHHERRTHVVSTYDSAVIASGAARRLDLVVVPAVNDPSVEQQSKLRTWLVQQARILGICAGSKLPAATRLLDGHRATSHWSRITPYRSRTRRCTRSKASAPSTTVRSPPPPASPPASRPRCTSSRISRRRGGGQGLPAGPVPRLDDGRVHRHPRAALLPQRRRSRSGRRSALVPAQRGRRARRRHLGDRHQRFTDVYSYASARD